MLWSLSFLFCQHSHEILRSQNNLVDVFVPVRWKISATRRGCTPHARVLVVRRCISKAFAY